MILTTIATIAGTCNAEEVDDRTASKQHRERTPSKGNAQQHASAQRHSLGRPFAQTPALRVGMRALGLASATWWGSASR